MPPSFAQLAPKPRAGLDQLLLALAAEFRPVDRHGALDNLDELARPLFGIAALPAEEAARQLIEVLARQAGFRVENHTAEALLLHRVLARRRGHPALLAATYHQVARRAGVNAGLVSSHNDWYVGFEQPRELVLVAPALSDGLAPCGSGLHRRCAHELCAHVLRELAFRLGAEGQHDEAVRAVGLRATLPPAH